MVAFWPLLCALSVLRYFTLITLERSWTCTWPLTLLPESPTRFSWKSTMNVRFGLVPTVAYWMLLPSGARSSQNQKTVGPEKLALGRAVFAVGLAPPSVPNWRMPLVPMVTWV